jgi:hypothetical protein
VFSSVLLEVVQPHLVVAQLQIMAARAADLAVGKQELVGNQELESPTSPNSPGRLPKRALGVILENLWDELGQFGVFVKSEPNRN